MQKQANSHPIKEEHAQKSSHLDHNSPLHPSTPLPMEIPPSPSDQSKNRRWTTHQHTYYKHKLKNKLLRRANTFFQDMSRFIITKTPTQCRSYHQKYEAKHKYPHRIIRQERKHALAPLLARLTDTPPIHSPPVPSPSHPSPPPPSHAQLPTQPSFTHFRPRPSLDGECQTEIKGVSTVLMPMDGERGNPWWPGWQYMCQWWGGSHGGYPPYPHPYPFYPPPAP